MKNEITIEATVNAPMDKVWKYWNEPAHIKQWCSASPDWHVPAADNDLKAGGKFTTTMAAKDGSFSFDFGGVYDQVQSNELIEYTIGDGRKVKIVFTTSGDAVKIVESFEPESQNPRDMQQAGWQAILNNFKSYTENN
ncbi:SRPBCC family protein [Cytophaga aurantiaca]|uniref:SRPBCC family protein n=1 Tax=Cytophaga aurantiaca TaxID=29530 RepID=UPI00037E1CDD|nr:SRPBCC family protein [Cytophaga aurantiaca]